MAKSKFASLESVTGRTDMYRVNPQAIIVAQGWNPRTDFTEEDELMQSIIENGVLVPLRVRRLEDDTIELVDGERRLRATLKAIAGGASIESVPVILEPGKMNDVDRMFHTLIANDGKRLTPMEEAEAFARLVKWGMKPADIAKRMGRARQTIYSRLELVNAAPEVKEALAAGDITAGQAQAIAKAPEVEKQTKALENAKEAQAIKKAEQKAQTKAGKAATQAATSGKATVKAPAPAAGKPTPKAPGKTVAKSPAIGKTEQRLIDLKRVANVALNIHPEAATKGNLEGILKDGKHAEYLLISAKDFDKLNSALGQLTDNGFNGV